MAQGVSLLPPNGFPPANILRLTTEIQQFDKLLKLRDEIVAGSHSRIKLGAPPAVNSNTSGINGITPNPTAQINVANFQYSGLPGLPYLITTPQNPVADKISDRQKVERNLEDAYLKDKPEPGSRNYQQDVLAGFDVTDAFYQAQDTAKPSSRDSNRSATHTPSVDNDTFYSSGAGTQDSAEHYTDKPTTRPCVFFFERGSCLKGDRCNFSHDSAFKQQLQKAGPTANRPLPRTGYTSQGGRIRDSPTYNNIEDGEVADEPPYSPSMNIAIQEVPIAPSQLQHNNFTAQNPRNDNRQNGRQSPRGKDTQVVRSHITSPIAPQPSRVSPLAVAKVSRFDQRPGDVNRNNARNQRPPSGTQTNPRSKKRRRSREAMDNARNVAPRTTLASPEPYIKPEPVSPPPLSAIPQPIRGAQAIDDRSSRYGDRPVYDLASDDYDRSVPRPISTHAALAGHRRVISGPAPIIEPRRQQDLRRIVSTRNLERPLSPAYDGSAGMRTSISYHSPREEPQPVSYRASLAPQRQTYVVDEHPASPAVRLVKKPEPEIIQRAGNEIVVDEFGNRYLRMIAPDRRMSAMPETRFIEEVRRPMMEPIRASMRPEARYVEERAYRTEGAPHTEQRTEQRYYQEGLRPSQVLPRASVLPEVRYYAESSRRIEPATLPRASMRPETRVDTSPRYYEERAKDTTALPRASVRPEARVQPQPPRYYEEVSRQGQTVTASRPSVHPEARAEAIFINPTFEQINMGGRPIAPERGRPQFEERYATRAPSPPAARSRLVEYRASMAPSSRPVYEKEPKYPSRQEFARPPGNERSLVHEAEGYARMAESSIGRTSVRPVEDAARGPMQYVERGYRPSIEPEVYRYQETRKEPHGYLPARHDTYGRQENMEPPAAAQTGRPLYRYISDAREAAPPPPTSTRLYDRDIYVD